MNTLAHDLTTKKSISWGPLLKMGLLGTAAAATVNALLYLVAAAFGAMPQTVLVPDAGAPITMGVVIVATVLIGAGAVPAYALFLRFAREPVLRFRGVAGLLLVLSFVQPFALPGAPIEMIGVLELMHIVAAFFIAGALTSSEAVPAAA